MSVKSALATFLSATFALAPTVPLTSPDLTDLEPLAEVRRYQQPISDVDEARRAIAASVRALRAGRTPPTFDLTDEVYDALNETGELDAWNTAELELYSDDAERDDYEPSEDWFTCGHDPAWLDAHADDAALFMLGAPEGYWAYRKQSRGALFVSVGRFKRKSAMPRFLVPVGVDSGGFITLTTHGRYLMTHEEYVAKIRHIAAGGGLVFAACMDHMCEQVALKQTGATIFDHQRRTVASFLRLRELAPEIPWLPVLQGQTVEDYLRHLDMYRQAGVDLTEIARVGVGSICRRTRTEEIDEILDALHARGLRLHMFGGKSHALRRNHRRIRSADSMAWSKRGQWESFTEGAHDSQGRLLQNSQEYAEAWRGEMDALANPPKEAGHEAMENFMQGSKVIQLHDGVRVWDLLRRTAFAGIEDSVWSIIRVTLVSMADRGMSTERVIAFAERNSNELVACVMQQVA